MRTPNSSEVLAQRGVLILQLIVLAVGALQFALAPSSVRTPILAGASLVALSLCLVSVRLIPDLRRAPARLHAIDLGAMLVVITLLIAASGGARSVLVSLYIAPLAAAAFAFGRWWVVLLIGVLISGVLGLLATITPGVEVAMPQLANWLLATLAPGTSVAVLLALIVGHMRRAAQKINDLSATDALTGLLNLRAFESVLEQEHRKAERFGRSYALIVVDVDNLTQINETLGLEAGSLIINAVAAAISRSVRSSDVTARLGGDEFIVLCVESNEEISAAIAQRIRNNVYAGTVSVANRLIRANVSVGVANYPRDHLYPKELLMLASRRMQQDRDLRREVAVAKG